MILRLFTIITVLFCENEAAKILAVFPMPSISHQVTFRPLTHELARRGHEVTVITTDPAFPKGEAPKNIREIDVSDAYNVWSKCIGSFSTGNIIDQRKMSLELFSSIFELELQNPEVQDLIKNRNEMFDLLILELCVPTALGFSHIFKAPVILTSSFGGIPQVFDSVGAPSHPIIYSTTSTFKINNKTILDKFIDLLTYLYTYYMIWNLELSSTDMLKKHFGEDCPKLSELSKNIDMIFLNIHPIWEDNRPVPPNVIYMGGIHQKPPKELSMDLKNYLDSSKHGVIFFSLGTNVISSSLPPEKLKTIIKVFSELPYDILWKWDGDEMLDKPKNVRTEKWLPQPDLLRHPNIKLFITQGGIQSTDEAITAGVPLLGIPMLADQWFNVERYVQLKIGVRLDLKDITQDTLKNAINTVIEDTSYRRNIEELRDVVLDQPQRPAERVVWWTEHVLRHGGALHLRSPAANMSWVEYYEIQLLLLLLAGLLTTVSLVMFILRKCIRIFKRSMKIKSSCTINKIITMQLQYMRLREKVTSSKMLFSIIIFTTLIFEHEAAKILAVIPTASISHQVPFRPLTQELARRGHEVTVITTDPAFPKGKAPKNLREIDVHDVAYEFWNKKIAEFATGHKEDNSVLLNTALDLFSNVFGEELASPQVQELIKNKNETFDLVFAELCVPSAMVFGHFYKAPVIVVNSLGSMGVINERLGSPNHPLVYSFMISSNTPSELSMWKKINEIYDYFNYIDVNYKHEEFDHKMLKKYFGEDIPTLSEMSKNIHMVFLNVHQIWENNRPVPPNVIYMGGTHQKPEKELPKDLKTYLDSSEHGVIYFSLGTNNVPSELLSEKIQVIVNVFSKLPYDILWKYDKELLNKPANVRLEKWLPQSDLLRHPKIKLFITQGGLQSTSEAITAAVPLVGIPIMADQWYNVARYVQHKIGVKVDFGTFSEDTFMNAIKAVINDESYRRNIHKLRDVMQDQPQGSLERAVWWTEHVLRHGGAEHLRSPAANMSWTQYYEIQLLLLLLAGLLTAVSLVVFMVYTLLRCVCRSFMTPVKIKRS
ncbi:uncharacterized protein LOC115452065 [Manduca sexta]|uniref:uncharacterized protein LOC115452065 n=1 Tax=Manduca sexta TaxID=7130 RepID=UPI00188F8BAC|nr:uncharacterized protein LOC115452065 [Manduca sexta]